MQNNLASFRITWFEKGIGKVLQRAPTQQGTMQESRTSGWTELKITTMRKAQ